MVSRPEPASGFIDGEPVAERDEICWRDSASGDHPYVVAEIDHLAATRLGTDAEQAILREG